MDFAPLHVGRTSPVQTVKVSNAGGGQPLDVQTVTIAGANPASFEIADNRCTALVDAGRGVRGRRCVHPAGRGRADGLAWW